MSIEIPAASVVVLSMRCMRISSDGASYDNRFRFHLTIRRQGDTVAGYLGPVQCSTPRVGLDVLISQQRVVPQYSTRGSFPHGRLTAGVRGPTYRAQIFIRVPSLPIKSLLDQEVPAGHRGIGRRRGRQAEHDDGKRETRVTAHDWVARMTSTLRGAHERIRHVDDTETRLYGMSQMRMRPRWMGTRRREPLATKIHARLRPPIHTAQTPSPWVPRRMSVLHHASRPRVTRPTPQK